MLHTLNGQCTKLFSEESDTHDIIIILISERKFIHIEHIFRFKCNQKNKCATLEIVLKKQL